MSNLFPLLFANEQVFLLTALAIGFGFGFALERAGFGNARKLAAQFYLSDMTVFKVMFTAILVAMVGLFSLRAWGLVDLDLVWVNPNHIAPQLLGGFLLGVGFIISGLCPGTSVVSLASGKLDGLMVFAGAFIGTFLFSISLDRVPSLHDIYRSGSGEVVLLNSLLPFDVPALWLAIGVVVMAGAAFIGAEAVERIFTPRRGRLDLTPPQNPRMKYLVIGALLLVSLTAAFTSVEESAVTENAVECAPLPSLTLADLIISADPNLIVLDLRDAGLFESSRIPGSWSAADRLAPLGLLQQAADKTKVVLYADDAAAPEVHSSWPRRHQYYHLSGGFPAWQAEVLTPAAPRSRDLDEMAFVRRQNQLSAFFSGAELQSQPAPPPPPAVTGGKKRKKASGGC